MEHLNLEYFCNLEKEGKKSVLDFCIKMGLIANTCECPNCKGPMKLTSRKDIHDGFAWCCKVFGKENAHRISRSVRGGSWFEKSSLSLTQILKLTYLWVTKASHEFIKNELKISSKTVGEWRSFCRRVCLEDISKKNIFLGGAGMVIEIDACKFSGSKVIRRKKASGRWVLGGVERGTNKCFLEIIQNGDKVEILNTLKKYVLPGTTIVSDCWKGYDCLEDEGYVHLKVDRSLGIKDPKTGEHINTIQGMWNHIRRQNTKISQGQFDTYLAEFMWRRLHREKTQDLLRSFFKSISDIYIPRIKDDSTLNTKKRRISGKEQNVVESIKIKIEPTSCVTEDQCTEENELTSYLTEDLCAEAADKTDGQNKRQKVVKSVVLEEKLPETWTGVCTT